MSRRLRWAHLVAACLLLVAAALGGCSSDDGGDGGGTADGGGGGGSAEGSSAGPDEEELVATAVDRCREAEEAITSVQPASPPFQPDAPEADRRASAEWARTYGREMAAFADGLEELDAPRSWAGDLTELREVLTGFADRMEALAAAIEDGSAKEPDVGRAFEVLARADVVASRLGIPGGITNCGERPAEPAEGAARVEVVATEYAFEVAEPVPSGPVAFVLRNEGTEIHEMTLVRELVDLGLVHAIAAERTGADASAFVEELGTVQATPAQRGVLNIDDLQPGTYGIVCFVPAPDGEPHAIKDQIARFTVS